MENGTEKNCNCCPGPMGPMGPQGIQGVQGVDGHQGQPGQNGSQGGIGPQGVPGPAGAPGLQGPAGAVGANGATGDAGLQGVAGAQGQPGQNGIQGAVGAMGPMGLQGLQGVPGNCVECPCHCDDPEFAEIYSIASQNLSAAPGLNLPGQVVILENTIFATPGINIAQASVNGKVVINKAGWYDVATGICGALNPIASPLPCWTLSLFKNGVYVPGSTFANQTISPEQKANEIVADVFVHFNVGDVLELANTSSAAVVVSAPTLGTNAQASSAYMKIIMLKAD